MLVINYSQKSVETKEVYGTSFVTNRVQNRRTHINDLPIGSTSHIQYKARFLSFLPQRPDHTQSLFQIRDFETLVKRKYHQYLRP